MGQTYSLSSTTDTVNDTVNDTVKDEIMIENKIDSENLIESDDSLINNESIIEKESENDEAIKEIVTKFVDEVIDNAINIHKQEKIDIFNREDFIEHRENIKNLITDDNESLISSVSSDSNSNSDRELYTDTDYDYDSESDSISVDAMEMEINNIEDIGVQVKMELLNSNKKIILLRGENERLKEEYDDLFFNFTRLKVKYDSLLCKRKRD